MFKIVIDEHIELKLVEEKDAKVLFHVIDKNRDYFTPWFAWLDRMTDETVQLAFIRGCMKDYGNGQGPKVIIWYDSKLVGFIAHKDYKPLNKSIALGYWLDEDYTGKGIMTKACKCMIDMAFERDINKVEIHCASENKTSRNIPKRLGFTEEGIVRAAELINGQYMDNVIYGMLKDEWHES